MTSQRCLRGLRAASLILILLAATGSAMVIRDGESSEIVTDTDVDATSGDTSPATTTTTSEPAPPPPSGMELMMKIGWTCGLTHPVSNVSLDTIMGRWYLVELISPSPEKRRDACAGVDFGRWDDEENNLMPDVVPPPTVGPEQLVMRGFNRHANEHHRSTSYRVDTATIVKGSGGAVWDQPVRSVSACTVAMAASVAVLDFTPDARFMTVTTCIGATGYEWTSVLSRDPDSSALPREELHQRLRAAGLRYVDSAKLQDNSDCVYP